MSRSPHSSVSDEILRVLGEQTPGLQTPSPTFYKNPARRNSHSHKTLPQHFVDYVSGLVSHDSTSPRRSSRQRSLPRYSASSRGEKSHQSPRSRDAHRWKPVLPSERRHRSNDSPVSRKYEITRRVKDNASQENLFVCLSALTKSLNGVASPDNVPLKRKASKTKIPKLPSLCDSGAQKQKKKKKKKKVKLRGRNISVLNTLIKVSAKFVLSFLVVYVWPEHFLYQMIDGEMFGRIQRTALLRLF